MTGRSMTLRNSRIFPGQSYFWRIFRPSRVSIGLAQPNSGAVSQTSQRYFSSKMCAVFLKEGYILFLKGWCPMMFELVLDLTDPFLNLRDTNAECAIALLPRRV
jgi:hypothetical protein